MNIEDLIDELEDLIEESWNLPLTGGRVIVNSEKIKELTENIRLSLPNEIRQAQAIVKDRAQIIKDAKKEGESIVKVSEDRAKKMVVQSEIVKQAEAKAHKMIQDAQAQVLEIKKAANDYAENIMQKAEEVLSSSLIDIRNIKKEIKSSTKS